MPTVAAMLALALADAAAAPPRAALEGCSATPLELGWLYECADVQARSDDLPGKGDATANYAAAITKAALVVLGDGAMTRVERRKLGGAEVEVLVTEVPERRTAFYGLVMRYGPGTRMVTCFGPNERCGAVLAASAWRGANAPGSVRKEPAPLQVAGHALVAPPGCQVTTAPGSGTISCGPDDRVTWTTPRDETVARRMQKGFPGMVRDQLAVPGWSTAQSEMPCTLAGAETTCARVIANYRDAAITVLWGVARVGETFVFAGCVSRGKDAGPACSLLLHTR